MLALIVAVAHNRVIGKDNTLIWHLPNDLKFFKEKTTGHVLLWAVRPLKACRSCCQIVSTG